MSFNSIATSIYYNQNIEEYEEFYIIKDNRIFKFIVGKMESEIIINYKNYEIIVGMNDLYFLVKKKFNAINDVYMFFVNIFEENKVIIMDKNEKILKILLKYNIENKEKEFELTLTYNKKCKNLIINKLKEEIDKMNNEINVLKENLINRNNLNNKGFKTSRNSNNFNNIDNYKNINIKNINTINNLENAKEIYSELNNEFKTNPQNIKFSKNLIKDSYSHCSIDNTFTVFKALDKIIYIIYSTKEKSIISYNLNKDKKAKEIKNAHNEFISNIRHYLDKINEMDLILTISGKDNNLKIYNFNKWECLLNIKPLNKKGHLRSACLFFDKEEKYFLSSNDVYKDFSEFIKIYDFKGNHVNTVPNSDDRTAFMDTFYDNETKKNYIITGNTNYVKSYFYINSINNFQLYKIYNDNDKYFHDSIVIYYNEGLLKMIESSEGGILRIWNFNSGELLKRIKVIEKQLCGICLWNCNYLFVGCHDNSIKLIDIIKGTIIKSLEGHEGDILTIKKIIHPLYGEYLITQAIDDKKIKLWN